MNSTISLARDIPEISGVVADLVRDHCPPDVLRSVAQSRGTHEPLWTELVKGGWTGIAADEEQGGEGQDVATLQLVLLQLGYAAAPVPYRPVIGEALLLLSRVLPPGDGAAQIVRRLVRGEVWVPAISATPGSNTDDASRDALTASREFVEGATRADGFVVAVRDEASVRWYAVPRSAEGITVTAQANPSDEDIATVEFASSAATLLSETGPEALEALQTISWVARATWTAGLLRRVLEMTVAHVGTRKQFGRTIGSFQAVQHKLADVTILTQLASDLCRSAAICVDEHGAGHAVARAEAAAAIDLTRRAAVVASRHAHQLWGGAGVSVEYDLHLYTTRLKTLVYCCEDHSVARDVIAQHQINDGSDV